MGWISERILSEKRKHDHNGIDWVRIAETKIKAKIKAMIKECEDKDYVGEFLIKKFDSENINKANNDELPVTICPLSTEFVHNASDRKSVV